MFSRYMIQAGVIPFRYTPAGTPQFLLVSRSGGDGWGFPKGRLEPGLTSRAQALVEAWEEAGLRGSIKGDVLTTVWHRKRRGLCRVDVYLMRVSAESVTFPEMARREKHWVTAEQAAQYVPAAWLPALQAAEERLTLGALDLDGALDALYAG